MKLLERLPGESGKNYALRSIKENIINLSLEPGSQISENEIAAEIGLSRTPVREALLDLSQVKIVNLYPQKKGVISLIDFDLIDESQFMRLHLEKAVMEIVCQVATEEDIQRLEENVRLQNFYVENPNSRELRELDTDFHSILFDIAGKPLIYQVMNTIAIHLERVRNMSLSPIHPIRSVHDHEDMIEAIQDHDAHRACAMLDVHLMRYKILLPEIREKFPQYLK